MIRPLVPLVPAGLIPLYADVTVNPRVLGFTLAVTVLTGIACGLSPILRRGGADVSDALRQGARTASSGLGRLRRPGLMQALVAGEVALAHFLQEEYGLMLRRLSLRLSCT